ncbi:hypothetical protein SATRM34S_00205 [Streptomyces atroolivaceus]
MRAPRGVRRGGGDGAALRAAYQPTPWARASPLAGPGGPLGKPTQVRDPLSAFVTGLKGFGGLGTFFWEPQGYAPFIEGNNSCAWDPTTRRPIAALEFLNA